MTETKRTAGPGRPKNGTIPVMIRITPEQKEWLPTHGRSNVIRELIKAAMLEEQNTN
jgi:hypothetical protein